MTSWGIIEARVYSSGLGDGGAEWSIVYTKISLNGETEAHLTDLCLRWKSVPRSL